MPADLVDFLYSELFPTGAQSENSDALPWRWGEPDCRAAGHSDAVLFLFVDSALYWIYQRGGCPLGVTFSFLISSPMVDLGSLVLLMSIFGAKIAVLYVIIGLVIAVAGGTLIEKLRLEDQVEEFIRSAGPGLWRMSS